MKHKLSISAIISVVYLFQVLPFGSRVLGTGGEAWCQTNNLYFNQVIFSAAPGSVPAGKVWKIESVVSSNTGSDGVITTYGGVVGGGSQNPYLRITIGGIVYYIPPSGSSYYTGGATSVAIAISGSPFPIWVPAGTSVSIVAGAALSIIEFTIAP